MADCHDTASDCVVSVPVRKSATICDVLAHLGIGPAEVSNLFLNGELSAPTRRVRGGDRLGIFPSDMALLYKWYFAREE